MPEFYWSQAHLAQAYAQLGRTREAKAAADRLLEVDPDFARNARAEPRIWNVTDAFLEHELEGLRRAGLEIPDEARLSRSAPAS
jgi:hypothetical protein